MALSISLVFFFLLWHTKQEKKKLVFIIENNHLELKGKINKLQEKQRDIARLQIQLEDLKETVLLQKREIITLEKNIKLK
ncbi:MULTISPECIES: hypothetical protein [Acinetobacter]|uniref:hypothetical protein n=1 Tax=Acinetobacter TaxID=469 RepID=UPI000C4134AD|nr:MULTISPECIES: hypothetical protein [Acinetobacter]MBC68470.1 hypothetical protein [Acinetobacter sp.]MBT50507.1 hypothetical protein [Acinetobacter sp.]HIQ35336.1 hypothetical protein [Acinetobacter venetianus]HJP47868.1 hypothetical protein [Acinetobacter venetianus]